MNKAGALDFSREVNHHIGFGGLNSGTSSHCQGFLTIRMQ